MTSPILTRFADLFDKDNPMFAVLQDVFLLLVRLAWGSQFAITGWGMLNNIEASPHFSRALVFPSRESTPMWPALLSGSVECCSSSASAADSRRCR
jgi:uncharacterized membrane protein YphA (DoxX/SURF4 family)